jgi:hypothetical protein
MSISSATPPQLQEVYNFSQLTRSIMIQLATLQNHCAIAMDTWNANILSIIGSPQGTLINDGTGLAGAVELTDTQLTNLVSIMSAIVTTYGTAANQQAIALAVGPNNMIG